MSQYKDLYIRMSLEDTGEIPRDADSGSSPDVIPYGNETVADPKKFFSANTNKYVAKDLLIGEANNIYIRMINYFTLIQTGEVFLYYALDSELDNPKIWKEHKILSASGSEGIAVSASKNKYAVTPEAFVWTPAELPVGEHYNLIAQVVTIQHPDEIPDEPIDFTAFVNDHGGIGWQTPIIPPPPVHPKVWETLVSYSQGPVERDMEFTLLTTNIAIGSYISLSSDPTIGPNPAIEIKPTKVLQAKFSIGIPSTVPADYKGKLKFTLMNADLQARQPAGSYVELRASYFEEEKRITSLTAQTTNQ
jgi:hypothetical protein